MFTTSTVPYTALVIPAAYHSAKSHTGGMDDTSEGVFANTQVVDGSDLPEEYNNGLRIISRGTAILLLFVYIAYLFFQVCTSRNHNQCWNLMTFLHIAQDPLPLVCR